MNDRVLLEGDLDVLAAPFGDGVDDVELDGEDGVGVERVVAVARDAALLVPQADRRPGGMAVDAEGMRVDARPQALVLGPLERRGQDLVPGQALLHLAEEDVLEPVALGQGVFRPWGASVSPGLRT